VTTEERSKGGEGLAAEKRLCFFDILALKSIHQRKLTDES